MEKPQFVYYTRLDYEATWKRFKRFFALFPYQAFNTTKLEENKEEEQIRYRRANIRSCAQEAFRLIVDALCEKRKKEGKQAPRDIAMRFALATFRTSLATSLFRTPRSIDRYIEALLDMGFLVEKNRTHHGIELVFAASLFVFAGEVVPPSLIPTPAAEVPLVSAPDAPVEALDPWQRTILANTAIGERMAQKFGVSLSGAPTCR